MNMRNISVTIGIAAMLLLTGCAKDATYITPGDVQSKEAVSLGIDDADIEKAVIEAVQGMLKNPYLMKNDNKQYVVAISTVTNDTMQRFDTDLLTKKIRIELLQNGKGKFITTTAVRAGGAEDAMSMQARQLRNSKEFNQKTVAAEGQMIAPDYSLSGKVIQRDTKTTGGAKRVDYSFQLSMTDIRTGLAFWEGETKVSKLGSNNSTSW